MNKIVPEGYRGIKKEMIFNLPIEALKIKPKDTLAMFKNKNRYFVFGEGQIYTFDKDAFLKKEYEWIWHENLI